MLTQNKLKEFLHYNPGTGWFTRIKKNTGANIGDVVGETRPKDTYILVGIGYDYYPAHRLAWFYVHGVWLDVVDHINHIRSDNRIINLRNVTHQENSKNIRKFKKNTSGVAGVRWNKEVEKWVSNIKVADKLLYLGAFDDKFEAICARLSANNKYGYHHNHGR